MKVAVLLNTHFLNDEVWNRFNLLKEDAPDNFEFFIIQNNESVKNPYYNIYKINNISVFEYSSEALKTEGYKLLPSLGFKSIMWSNGSLMPINLFQKHFPDYDYYWSIEYDIIFNGKWKYFFDTVHKKDFDFCTSHLGMSLPDWWWYSYITIPGTVSNTFIQGYVRMRSFNTICAFSNRFLKYLDKIYKMGFYGNCEQTIPTAAFNSKEHFKIIDLASDLNLCSWESNNWQVYYENINTENYIYHPVKIKQ